MTLFDLLELGRRALQAHQAAVQTAGHNVANAQTPGFSRQRVELIQSPPETLPAGQLGTGVSLEGLRRLRDQFLDLQFRRAASSLGEAEVEEASSRRVQSLLDEPSDRGVGFALSRFFSSLQELSTDPPDPTARFGVRESGLTLASTFRRLDSELERLKGDLEEEITLRVQDVNQLARRIADLNRQIRGLEAGGASANDLKDQRDRLVDDLSRLVGLSTLEHPDGTLQVTVAGGILLVEGVDATALAVERSPTDTVQVTLSGSPITVTGGKLKGLLSGRNDLVLSLQAQLNSLAERLIEEVNALHRQGYGLDGATGRDFFTGTDAGTMDVAQDIQADPRKIAAAATPTPGDNGNALALARLRQQLTMNGETATFEGFFGALVGEMGLKTQTAGRLVTTHRAMVDALTNRREEVSGVSVDEELTHLIEHQRVYEALAHFVRVVDRLLETLISQLG